MSCGAVDRFQTQSVQTEELRHKQCHLIEDTRRVAQLFCHMLFTRKNNIYQTKPVCARSLRDIKHGGERVVQPVLVLFECQALSQKCTLVI